MLKSRRLAYDGRGNAVAHCKEDITAAVSGKIHCHCYYLFVQFTQKGNKLSGSTML